MTHEEDVPYGENFHDVTVAAAWAETAMQKRPWRPTIFEKFADMVLGGGVAAPRVLELGSGPGLLAEHVLRRCPHIAQYTLFDFSETMLAQSRTRLGEHVTRTLYVRGDFKDETWPAAVGGTFDFVFALQSVHELRHKRHAPRLYEQIRALLAPDGEVVICDHLPESGNTPRHALLYMTIPEHLAAFASAGYTQTEVAWNEHAMAMYCARP